MKMRFTPFPHSSHNPFFVPRGCTYTPKTKATKKSPLEPGCPKLECCFPCPWCNEPARLPPLKKILFLFHLLYAFGDVPVPFDFRRKVFFFCILQRVFLFLSQCKLRDGVCSCRLGSRTHTPAMSTIPMVRSFQVIALFYFPPNALDSGATPMLYFNLWVNRPSAEFKSVERTGGN